MSVFGFSKFGVAWASTGLFLESAKVTGIDKHFKVIFKEKKSENEIGQPAYI